MKSNKKKEYSLYTFLDKVYRSKRPEMFFGSREVAPMERFIAGYTDACYEFGIKQVDPKKYLPFRYFRDWLEVKLDIKLSVQEGRLIIEHLGKDGPEAMDMYFNLLEEFKKIKVSRIEEGLIDHAIAKQNTKITQKKFGLKIEGAPSKIYFLHLSDDSGVIYVSFEKTKKSTCSFLWSRDNSKQEEIDRLESLYGKCLSFRDVPKSKFPKTLSIIY